MFIIYPINIFVLNLYQKSSLLDILKQFDSFHLDSLQPTVSDAIGKALTLATNEDIILVTGSFSIVGETLEKLEGIKPEIY